MTTSQHDQEDAPPGLAEERTALAWTRTAISFAAVGGVMLKENLVPGLIILATALVIWRSAGWTTIARAGSSWSPRRSSSWRWSRWSSP